MAINTTRWRKVWDRQVRRLGGRTCAIRRAGATDDILIVASVSQYDPREARGGLVEPTDLRCVISTYAPDGSDLGTVPDKETDQIVLYSVPLADPPVDEAIYKIVMPPVLYSPHGVLCLMECQVRR